MASDTRTDRKEPSMRVREIMSAPVISVGPDAEFKEIVGLLLEHDISGLPVVGGDDELLGVITEADLVSKDAYGSRRRRPLGLIADYLRGRDPRWVKKAAGRTARDLMTAHPTVAAPDDPVGVVARSLVEHGRKRLPVVEGGRVVGIVARPDLLRSFLRPDAEIGADVEKMLVDPLRCPEDASVTCRVEAGVVTLEGSVRWPSDASVVVAMARGLPGVVDVEALLTAREPDPTLGHPLMPPLA